MNIQQSNSFIGNEKKLIFEKNVEMIEHLNKLKDKLKDHKYWKETGIYMCVFIYLCIHVYLYVYTGYTCISMYKYMHTCNPILKCTKYTYP